MNERLREALARDGETHEGRCPWCDYPLRGHYTAAGPAFTCDCIGPAAGIRQRDHEERKGKARLSKRRPCRGKGGRFARQRLDLRPGIGN